MNGNLVQGANCTVFKYDTDLSVWVPYACARSASLSLSTDTIETSITGSGNFRTYLPVADSFTGSLDGVTQLEMVNKISIADLMSSQIAHEIFLMRFEDINNDGDVFTKEGYFFITNTTQTASFDNVATFSVNLQGTGPLTLIYTPTPLIFGVMQRAEFVLLMGNTSVTVPDVDGVSLDNIINIAIDGYSFPVIIGSGTPIGQEVKYQPGGAIITVPFANDDTDLNGFIEYQIIYEAS